MNRIDPQAVEQIIRQVAAEKIMPRYRQLQQGDISTKSGPNDLVTIADREAEMALDAALAAIYPQALVVGEESVSEERKTLAALQGDGMVFVTDPVDGTWNFVHGKKEFCVMLALVDGGIITHGWIYDVLTDRMMSAERGSGAFFAGERLKVAEPKVPQDLCGHAGRKYFPKELRPFVEAFKPKVRELYSISCAGHEYLRIASGVADFGIYSRIRPWDHFAGTLAVIEAGGYVAKWDSTPYTPRDDFGGLAAAANVDLWRYLDSELLKLMIEEIKVIK